MILMQSERGPGIYLRYQAPGAEDGIIVGYLLYLSALWYSG